MLFLTMLFSEHAKFIMTPKKQTHLASVKLGIPGSQTAQNILMPVEQTIMQRKKNPKHSKLEAQHEQQKRRRIKRKELMELMEDYLQDIEREKEELKKHLEAEHKIFLGRIEEADKIIELALLRRRQEEIVEYIRQMEAVMDALERDNPGFRDSQILDLAIVEKMWHEFQHALAGITVPFDVALKKLSLDPQVFAPITPHPNRNTLCMPRVMFDQNHHPYTTLLFLAPSAQGIACGIYDKNPSQHDVNIAYQQLVFTSLFFPCANKVLIPKCEGDRAVQLWNTATQFGLQPVWGDPPPRLSLDQQNKLLTPTQRMEQPEEGVRHRFSPDNPYSLRLTANGS